MVFSWEAANPRVAGRGMEPRREGAGSGVRVFMNHDPMRTLSRGSDA